MDRNGQMEGRMEQWTEMDSLDSESLPTTGWNGWWNGMDKWSGIFDGNGSLQTGTGGQAKAAQNHGVETDAGPGEPGLTEWQKIMA